jgi:hypothetical protein
MTHWSNENYFIVWFSDPLISQFGCRNNKYKFYLFYFICGFSEEKVIWEENIFIFHPSATRSSLYVGPNSQWDCEWCRFKWGSIYQGLAPFVLLEHVAPHKLTTWLYKTDWYTHDCFKVLIIVSNKNFIWIKKCISSFLRQISYHKEVCDWWK